MPSLEPAHILLAEDSPGDQRLIAEALNLSHLNHKLHIVDNGEEAARVARTLGTQGEGPCPDLFILDLGLPRVDGLEVLRAFRSNKHCTNIPVIVFTASQAPEHRLAAEKFAGVRFIAKPTDLEEFLALGRTVKNMLLRSTAQ